MALQPRLVRIDDFTQLELEEDGTTVIVVVDDGSGAVKYELDFSQASAKAFRDAMEPFLRNAAGYRIPPKLRREIVAVKSSAPPVVVTRKMIREWWGENWKKLKLPEPGPHGKGRIPREVSEAYFGRRNGATGPGGDEGISGEVGDTDT